MKTTDLRYRMLSVAIVAIGSTTLTGCFDDNYDLSDIDTTVKVAVNDLVLPIRIDAITLNDVISLDDDSNIKIVDGTYVLVEDGSFSSDPIDISAINIQSPTIDPIVISIGAGSATGVSPKATTSLSIGRHTASFNYSAHNISESIKTIDHIGTSLTISMTINVSNPVFSSYHFSNLQLQLPAGLEGTPSAGTYDASTGIATISSINTTNGSLTYKMTVTGIDSSKAHLTYTPSTRSLVFADEIGIANGQVSPEGTTSSTSVSSIALTVKPTLSTLTVTSFSGLLNYTLDGMSISPISLSSLPSVLNQSGTDLSLANPQIYLNLNNPLGQYGLTAQAGIEITPWRNGTAGKSYGLDNSHFTIPATQSANTQCKYCMSPIKPDSYQSGYGNAIYEPYSGLREILKGNGLPDELAVSIVNPSIPQQQVSDLPVGSSLGNVRGTYSLYAPLALAEGSSIVYTSTESGWNDEDVDAIVIEDLEVSATITNNLPISVHLSGYPIDKNGNRINGVEITGADIEGNTTTQPLAIRISGTVTHLDGITFTATAYAGSTATALSPNLNITLSDIRAKVSGYYTKEL